MVLTLKAIFEGRALLAVALSRRGVPPDIIQIIVDAWSSVEFRRWQRNRRSMFEFSLDGERFYGPGY